MAKRRSSFITGTPLAFTDLIQMHSDAYPIFSKKWEIGVENERYVGPQHRTDEAIAKIEKQDRQAYSFALVANKINTILAMQRSSRTSFRVDSAQDPNDDIKAELATIEMKDFERRTDFKYRESEVFTQGVGVQYGALEIFLDVDQDYNKIVSCRPVDYRLVDWDSNSRDYLLKDALWVAKRRQVYRKQLRAEYGPIADSVPLGDSFSAYDREIQNYFISTREKNGLRRAMDYDLITEVTHYQQVERTYYCVMMDDFLNLNGAQNSPLVAKFRTRKEAEQKAQEVKIPYLSIGQSTDVEIVTKKEKKYDKYVFTYVGILEYEETDLDDPPILVYRSFHLLDDWWTMTDLLKDPQQFLDRLISQVDYSLGTDVKTAFEADENALSKNETKETAQRKLTKMGGVIWKQTPAQAFTPIPSKGANPEYMNLAGVMQSFIEDLAGGRSFQGLQNQGEESGKAIALKQAQGQLITELFIDNLTRWKQYVGEVVLDWMGKFETGKRTIKVMGDSIDPQMKQLLQQKQLYRESQRNDGQGFVTLNDEDNEESYLKDARLELVVSEGELTETDNDQKLAQLMAYSKITGSPVPPDVVLQYMKMDYSLKNKLKQAQQQQAQQQQAQMQAEMQMQQDKNNIEKAKVLTRVPK